MQTLRREGGQGRASRHRNRSRYSGIVVGSAVAIGRTLLRLLLTAGGVAGSRRRRHPEFRSGDMIIPRGVSRSPSGCGAVIVVLESGSAALRSTLARTNGRHDAGRRTVLSGTLPGPQRRPLAAKPCPPHPAAAAPPGHRRLPAAHVLGFRTSRATGTGTAQPCLRTLPPFSAS